MKKIAILGTGSVGQTFASRFIALGYDVMIGTRNVTEKNAETASSGYGSQPFKEWHSLNKQVRLGTFKEASAFGEILLNATKGSSSVDALKLAGAENLKGKVLIDVANPLDSSKGMPPTLLPELSNTNSLGEEIQRTFPDLKVVKTLNTMWNGLMVAPDMLNNGDHVVFICGNSEDAKETVRDILRSFGWKDGNILDLGDITSARGTEMYLPLWLRIFGATNNGAFNIKVVR
ncbi:MAG: NADPH-dependent F420 reductase [Actinomycetota bacterium]|jgi:predicted dinucleotide-binding enzyme